VRIRTSHTGGTAPARGPQLYTGNVTDRDRFPLHAFGFNLREILDHFQTAIRTLGALGAHC